jgi:hypothetical protein
MAKMSISKQALSHAKAYVTEFALTEEVVAVDSNQTVRDDGTLRAAVQLFDALEEIKSIKELMALFNSLPASDWAKKSYDIQGFYNAMKKVIPNVCKENDEDTWEHEGTECRGWYRVWGDIAGIKKYFCMMDLGRDQWMVEHFHLAGIITDKVYEQYKTRLTLHMMNSDRFQSDGFPDVNKILNYWKPECQNQVLDMRLIKMLEAV